MRLTGRGSLLDHPAMKILAKLWIARTFKQ